MRFESEILSARQFCKSIRRDPVTVFLKGMLGGREQSLTAATLIEEVSEFAVIGPMSRWRVHVRREAGRLHAVPVRIRDKPSSRAR